MHLVQPIFLEQVNLHNPMLHSPIGCQGSYYTEAQGQGHLKASRSSTKNSGSTPPRGPASTSTSGGRIGTGCHGDPGAGPDLPQVD